MKLLFDHHLSPRLVLRLADLYPDSAVATVDSSRRAGSTVGLLGRKRPTVGEAPTVATRYNELIAIGGFPPKGVWIRRGNSPTNEIETLRRTHRDALEALTNDPDAGLLALL